MPQTKNYKPHRPNFPEFAKGGGDATKLTNEMNKAELQAGKLATTQAQLGKNQRQANESILDSVLSYTTLAGSVVQIIQGLGKLKGGLGGISGAFRFLGPIIAGAGSLTVFAAPIVGFVGVFTAVKQNLGGIADIFKGINEAAKANLGPLAGIADHMGKSFESHTQGIGAWGETLLKAMGIPIAEAPKAASETDKLSKSQQKAQGVTATLTTRFGEQGRAIQENQALTEAQSAALNEVTGSALETAAGVAQAGEAVNRLTEADVESITKLQEHTRAQIVSNAGYNNAKVAALQYQQALTTMTQSMVQDTDEKNANAKATLALANSNLNAENTALTLREEYANSVDALADLSTTMGDAELSSLALQTALNEQACSIQEEEMELRASIAATDDKAIAQQELENAYLRGVASIDEWATGLASAEKEEQGAIDRLADLGITFSDLPGYMEPTVESLQTFAEAAAGSGEATQAMADMASEAFQTMMSEGQKMVEGLSDALLEGGEDLEENWQKAWEKIPESVRKSMSDAQKEELSGIARMEAMAKASVIELGIDLKTEDFEKARADFTTNLKNMAAESDGIWQQVWSRAARIGS